MKLLTASTHKKLQTLRANIYFEGLDKSALEMVAANMRLYQFRRKETIFLE